MSTQLHQIAPTGSQLQVSARFERSHFVPGGVLKYFRRMKAAAGFLAKRPRVRNENQDPSRQVIPGVNVEADLSAIKFDLQPDVDSIVPFRACHNGYYSVGSQLATAAGTGTVATNGTTAIVGVGTAFTTQLAVGKWITITGELDPLQIGAIADNTHLTLVSAATTTASGQTFVYATVPVFLWSYHPKTPTEAAPATYVESMDFEVSNGDGYPVVVYEAQQQDCEIKIANGKIQEMSENWMACYDTFLSDATVVRQVSTYSATPAPFGHLSTANAALLPFNVRVTSAAGGGADGQIKAAFVRTLTGTLQTLGTTAIVGTATHFLTELAVGDEVYISGETPRFVATITDDTHLTVTIAAATTATGLAATAATFAGAGIPFTFDTAVEVKMNGARIGVSSFDAAWLTFPSGNGTVSSGDEWQFTEPRTLATPVYSTADVLHSAGVAVLIDGVPFGGVPGFAGFHAIDIKLTVPKVANKTTGSKYAQAIYPNGRTMATISFDRDMTDRSFLNKLIQASNISITVNMVGNPFGDTGYDQQWSLVFANCEIADNTRDVATENVLPEKINVNAVRAGSTPVWSESIYSTLGRL